MCVLTDCLSLFLFHCSQRNSLVEKYAFCLYALRLWCNGFWVAYYPLCSEIECTKSSKNVRIWMRRILKMNARFFHKFYFIFKLSFNIFRYKISISEICTIHYHSAFVWYLIYSNKDAKFTRNTFLIAYIFDKDEKHSCLTLC